MDNETDLIFATLERVDLLAEKKLRGKKRGPKPKTNSKYRKKSIKWQQLPPPYTVGENGFSYSNIPYVYDKVSPDIYLPLAFDIVKIILENSREIPGWHDGEKWVSRRLKNRKVKWWRRDLYG